MTIATPRTEIGSNSKFGPAQLWGARLSGRAKDPAVRRRIDERKREIYLSTLLIEEMKSHKLSVRQLAERARVSATTIQSIRAGEADNIGLAKLDHILSFVGRTIDFPPVQRGS